MGSAPRLPGPLATAAALLSIATAALWAYQGVWRGEFVFDDHGAIAENAALQAGDWWGAAFGTYQSLANRPLACASLVLDFAVFGPGPFGPHLTNLLLHLGNALLLWLVVRRTLLTGNLAGRFGDGGARWLPTTIVLLWVCHPLTVDAVAYATQRSALLYSGFLLAALWATLRTHAAARRWPWHALVWTCVACGMASKEEMLLAPVLIVLFERAFLLPDWRALRAHVIRHAVLALTWIVLAACVLLGPSNRTVGFATTNPVTWWQWLLTEAPVVAHYLQLALWPVGLRGAYGWPIVRELGPVVLPGLLVLAVLAATVVAWRRRPWLGWLGALFFLLLTPTSTVLPIVTELAAERRVYLPMLLPLVAAIVAVRAGFARVAGSRAPRLGAVAATAVACVLAATTRERVRVYRSDATLWADAFAQLDPAARSPNAARILGSHAVGLKRAGRTEESQACLDRAMACEDMSTNCVVMYSLSLLPRGRYDDAIRAARRLLQLDQGPKAWTTLGACLALAHAADGAGADDPRLAEAEAALLRGAPGLPDEPEFWHAVAHVQTARGQLAEAERTLRLLLKRIPDDARGAAMLQALQTRPR